ncbi:hypothetical protein HWV62_18404 [Athelia sp. TMB]|nr:hypothetical protein HWV62_32736 [Athelia sp. TMB]KAF7983969.1 hypothetical protein HWV62_18404 [Athelia sp. TMB]
MSRPTVADTLPPTARAIALLLSSTPTVQDAQPGVLHQLLEFSHRYTTQVLSDALVYSEFAGRAGKVEMDDVVLAVQARVGWEFGGRIPKEYTLSLAATTNSVPLPSVPEVFGIRLPPAAETLTAIDFDLVPSKPPPGTKLYDEEIEEVEESESEEEEDEDEDMEPAAIPPAAPTPAAAQRPTVDIGPVSAMQTPSDIDMIGTPAPDEGSDAAEEEDGLFAGGDEEDEDDEEGSGGDDAMEEVQPANGAAGVKRKLVEEEDYD